MNSPIKYKDEEKKNPLIAKPELFKAALKEFSVKSFHEASLNDMLKAVQMNKGSFYHRFYDKTDLYLCMMEMIALDKLEYMRNRVTSPQVSSDFFEQLKLLSIAGLEYAQHEKRYYSFWRNYLAESADLKNTVKSAFPELGNDFLEQLIIEAISTGQLPTKFSKDFICKSISIFFYNLDAFIGEDTEESEIVDVVEEFICFLKKGFA
ncbi:MAG: TetR/AcrR family transcriptional regulator [Enterocloster asparagiformis]|nr:TetR/AcrR family transcriptional regulator [Enterocloster asparagiformis]